MPKIKAYLKIIVGILVILGGAYLVHRGMDDLGTLDEMKLGVPKGASEVKSLWCEDTLCTSELLNMKFQECQKMNEDRGQPYSIKFIFVDGMLVDDNLLQEVRENEKQCEQGGK